MSVSRGFGINGKSFYTNIAKPMDVSINFKVDAANANGLGVSSVKSNGYVNNVFMHTSATPGSNNGTLNPNPAVGFALVQFKNNFNSFIGEVDCSIESLSGSDLPVSGSGLSANGVYVITKVGTTSQSQWASLGLPVGFTAALGQPFVSTATGGKTGTGQVQLPAASGIQRVEIVGDPNSLIANATIASNAGAMVMVSFLAATNSSTTTLIPAAPKDLSYVSLTFRFDGSSVTVDGL